MLCVTSNDIPGWEIQRVCGEVFGVTVRSRNAFAQLGAGFKSLVGGELGAMTKQVIQSRNEAMARLFAEAQARGGNALIAMRFDTTELGGNWSEICAYGTAVVAIPVTEEARQTALQLGYNRPGQPAPSQQPPAPAPAPAMPQQPAGTGQPPAPGEQQHAPSGWSGPGSFGQQPEYRRPDTREDFYGQPGDNGGQ